MESLFILIPLSLIAVSVAVFIFFKMSSSGQFEDDQGPAMSILLDDDSTVGQRVDSDKSESDKRSE